MIFPNIFSTRSERSAGFPVASPIPLPAFQSPYISSLPANLTQPHAPTTMFEGFPDPPTNRSAPTSIGEIIRTTQAAQLIHHAAQESLADDLIAAALANAGIPAHVRDAHDRQIARLESKPITVSATLRIDPETGALRILSADSDITAKLKALGPTIQVQITL